MNLCNSANTAGITCRSSFSSYKFLSDKIITMGVFHNNLVTANNAYQLIPVADITSRFSLINDEKVYE